MEEALLALLGAAATMIAALFSVVIIMMRRNGNHNPNLGTLDEKLNDILIVLTRIETVMQRCPASKGQG